MQDGQGTLLAELALLRARHWFREERPTQLWTRRYGGDFAARAKVAEALGLAQRGNFTMAAMSMVLVCLVSAILAVAITLYFVG
jgi:hypothetical protein